MSFKKYGGRQFRSANNIILSQHGTFYNQLIPTKIGDENIVSKIYTDLYVARNLTVNGTFYMQTFLTDDLHVTGFAAIDNDLTLGQKIIFADETVQTTAFTSSLNTDLSNLTDNCRNVIYLNTSDNPNTTQIGGTVLTNHLNLTDPTVDETAYITFSDGSEQTTAFTSSLNTDLSNLTDNCQNVIYLNTSDNPNTTQIGGTVLTNHLKLTDPTVDETAYITFSDGSEQTTAYDPTTRVSMTYFGSSEIWGIASSLSSNIIYSSDFYTFNSNSTYINVPNNVLNNEGQFIKKGRYIIMFSAEITNLEWTKTLASRIYISPFNSLIQSSSMQGIKTNSENYSTNIYYFNQCIVDIDEANTYFFTIYSEYNFKCPTTSATTLSGKIEVYEI